MKTSSITGLVTLLLCSFIHVDSYAQSCEAIFNNNLTVYASEMAQAQARLETDFMMKSDELALLESQLSSLSSRLKREELAAFNRDYRMQLTAQRAAQPPKLPKFSLEKLSKSELTRFEDMLARYGLPRTNKNGNASYETLNVFGKLAGIAKDLKPTQDLDSQTRSDLQFIFKLANKFYFELSVTGETDRFTDQGLPNYTTRRPYVLGATELLIIAIEKNNLRLLQDLLDLGANPNQQAWVGSSIGEADYSMVTPLYRSALALNSGAVAILLKSGANTNLPSASTGETALHALARAVKSKSIADIAAVNGIGRILMEFNADINAVAMNVNKGEVRAYTPLHLILKRKRDQIEARTHWSADMRISGYEFYDAVAGTFIRLGADVNSINHNGKTPFFIDPNVMSIVPGVDRTLEGERLVAKVKLEKTNNGRSYEAYETTGEPSPDPYRIDTNQGPIKKVKPDPKIALGRMHQADATSRNGGRKIIRPLTDPKSK